MAERGVGPVVHGGVRGGQQRRAALRRTSWSPLPGAEECEHYSLWGSAPDELFVANECGIGHWDGSTWTYMDPDGFVTELWGTGPHNVLANVNGGISRGSRWSRRDRLGG